MTATSDALGADRRLLSRNTEFGGTLTSAMVPWSDNGTFMAGILGVSTLSYLPFMWLSWISILLAFGASLVRTWRGKATRFSGDGQMTHLTSNPLLKKEPPA